MGRPVLLVLLVDALGWEIVERFGFGRDEFPVRAPLGTVLGYSSAAIPSLLSGATPAEHGSWSMFRRADRGGSFAFLSRLPHLPKPLEWRARRWVRRYTDARGGVRSYYSLYEIPLDLLHRFDVGLKGDPFQPGGLPRETVFDWMIRHGVRYRLWYYTTDEEANLTAAESALGDESDVLFVYTAELDALMHRVGIFHHSVEARLRRYAAFLSAMRRRAREKDVSLTTVVLSDHGMTDVTSVADPWGTMNAQGRRLGRDYLGFYDSTMLRVWGDSTVVDAATAAMGGNGRRLSDDELRACGCFFPGREYGDAVLLAHPGVLIVPSFMGSARIAAMHGYDPGDRFSQGCFMSDVSDAPAPASLLGFKSYLSERCASTGRA
ncbi:MAG TPA: alkaline phosphatase family protein [Candidatus Krumholzibacteria bacterium]|nr:alkaline phosphatase family protein [Candidatus Krumholzibacteria bacterium]